MRKETELPSNFNKWYVYVLRYTLRSHKTLPSNYQYTYIPLTNESLII